MRARNRELFGLIPASLLMSAGFAAVFIQRAEPALDRVARLRRRFPGTVRRGAHLHPHHAALRRPFIFPLVAVLACFGLVMVYRIDGATLARQQAQWFVLGLVLFAGTVIVFRDYRKLENYRYLIVIASLVLLVLPRIPALRRAGEWRLPRRFACRGSHSSRPSSPRSDW